MPAKAARRPNTKAAQEAKTARKCKGLIFGPPKHGKTTLLGTATFDKRTTPIGILDFEGGVLDVLDGLPGGPDGPKWYHRPASTWDQVNDFYAEAEEHSRSNAKDAWKADALDSLSELHFFALMNLLDDPGIRREEKDADLIQQPDYGKAMVQIRRFVGHMNDLPMHTFYTAHSKDEADPRLGLVKMVKMSGQLASDIPGMMSLVGYLALVDDEETGETRREILLQNYAKILTGVRMPWGVPAPDEIVNPTITNILDALKYK